MSRVHRALALAAAAAWSGCASDLSGTATKMGLPSAATSAQVEVLGTHGPYLDAIVSYADQRIRFFFPDDDFCRALLAQSEGLTYAAVGPLGQVRREEVHCDPIGLLSLAKWRDRRPRARYSQPLPRSRADYRVFYVDEGLFLARGRFPLAGLVGWPGGYDTVAVVSNVPECKQLMTRGTATMQFHQSGDNAIVLLDDKLRCPVLGFAQPVEGADGSAPAGEP